MSRSDPEPIAVDRPDALDGVRHVAFVIAGLGAGGAERVISLLADDWVARGRRVTIVSFDSEAETPFHPLSDRVRCVRLNIPPQGGGIAGLLNSARRCLALRRTLREVDADVTISFLTKINALTLLASLGTKRRVIVSERNNPRLQRASPAWTFALRRLYARAETVVMQTSASLECLDSVTRAKAHVIPNPISVDPIPGPPRTKSVLAATGRLAHQKGFDLLIEAFARIAPGHPAWTLEIWGEGEERAALTQQIARAGMTDRIVLRGNSRSTGEWVGQADAFVMSSRFEGFGNVLGEAMAGGLPVVSFDCDYGPREMIQHEHNGLLVPVGDVDALAGALDRLIGNAPLRRSLGDAARELGHRLHPRSIVRQWDALLSTGTPSDRIAR